MAITTELPKQSTLAADNSISWDSTQNSAPNLSSQMWYNRILMVEELIPLLNRLRKGNRKVAQRPLTVVQKLPTVKLTLALIVLIRKIESKITARKIS